MDDNNSAVFSLITVYCSLKILPSPQFIFIIPTPPSPVSCLLSPVSCLLSPLKNMQVQFREFNPFDVWFWLEFSTVPSNMEQQYVEEVFASWFYLGKLGAFNAENLQVQEVGVDISYMEYDPDMAENAFMSPMHNMTDFEYLGTWGRCWFDLGTSDLIALDILINALTQLSKDFVDIKRLIIGGENQDWPVSDRSNYLFSE